MPCLTSASSRKKATKSHTAITNQMSHFFYRIILKYPEISYKQSYIHKSMMLRQLRKLSFSVRTLKAPKKKLVGFANRVEPDEVAHTEPPLLELPYLPSILFIPKFI